MPAPAGAMMVMLPLTLSLSGLPAFPGDSFMILIWTAISTALIISRLPTFSGKGLGNPVPREWVLAILGGAVVILVLAFSHPFETISAVTILYVAMIPVAIQRFARRAALDRLDEAKSPSSEPR